MINGPTVAGIRSVDIEVTDLDRGEAFFRDVAGLVTVERSGKSVLLRGSSRYHHIVALHAAARRALRRVTFAVPGRDAVDLIRARVGAMALNAEEPRPISAPGRGYGFGFADPEGRNYAVVAEADDHTETLDLSDSPCKITHVNLNAGDRDATTRCLIDVLGYRLIDETPVNRFFNCGADHHSVVVGGLGVTTLNHIAFEMSDLDAMMRGAGRLRDAGYPIEWGPGRHGPGNNAFSYFIGPEDLPLEFTCEVLQIAENYVPGGPDRWRWPPGRIDQWGISDPPSARWRRVQHLVGFVPDGWRLPN
jgi:catechol-2,3-dioxygenase